MFREIIEECISTYEKKDPEIRWRKPIVSILSTTDEQLKNLKKTVHPKHFSPQELLNDSKSIIVYFLPLSEEIIDSNCEGKMSSQKWAKAYIRTNQLIHSINKRIKEKLNAEGYRSKTTKATHNFNEKTLISRWSHRHIAVIAGMGSFGLNNMLITAQGCCGRVGSLVTTKKIQPTNTTFKEFCLYKHDGSCKLCVDNCLKIALTEEFFDRFKCYEMCLENDAFHSAGAVTDVCGKCCVGLPCSTQNPVKNS